MSARAEGVLELIPLGYWRATVLVPLTNEKTESQRSKLFPN